MKLYLLSLLLGALAVYTASAQVPRPVGNGSATTTYAVVTEGSTPTHRSLVDNDSGQVYIYIGGSFPVGTVPLVFEYLFDFAGPAGNTTGYITPLLFERVPGAFYTIYVVVAIGQSFQVALNSSPQTIPFTVLEGIKVIPGSNYTFGYVNALVNAIGEEVAMSSGTVDFDLTADSGYGVGGSKTSNLWGATGEGGIDVALGTTFGGFGGTDFSWVDNISPIRTYSAQAYGVVGTQ
jgi:hypothetical protein